MVRLTLSCRGQEWQSVSRPTPPDPKGSNGNLTVVVAASGFFCIERILHEYIDLVFLSVERPADHERALVFGAWRLEAARLSSFNHAGPLSAFFDDRFFRNS